MIGELVDALGEERDLHLARSGVPGLALVLAYDLVPAFGSQQVSYLLDGALYSRATPRAAIRFSIFPGSDGRALQEDAQGAELGDPALRLDQRDQPPAVHQLHDTLARGALHLVPSELYTVGDPARGPGVDLEGGQPGGGDH